MTKYAIIVPDGAADEPLAQFGGKTPLEAADTPNMDRVSREGRQGLVRTVPATMEPGSDVAQMSLLGYDPLRHYSGRASIEAAALGVKFTQNDWVFRCNLVTLCRRQDGRPQCRTHFHRGSRQHDRRPSRSPGGRAAALLQRGELSPSACFRKRGFRRTDVSAPRPHRHAGREALAARQGGPIALSI